jgi:hypothetical protein
MLNNKLNVHGVSPTPLWLPRMRYLLRRYYSTIMQRRDGKGGLGRSLRHRISALYFISKVKGITLKNPRLFIMFA